MLSENCLLFIANLLVYTIFVFSEESVVEIQFCVRTVKEADKCEWLKAAVLAKDYTRISSNTPVVNRVSCVSVEDNYDCLEKIDKGMADVVNLDAGTAYYASINFVSTLLVSEKYSDSSNGVGDIAGWTLPLSILADKGILEVTDCNVNVKTASSFFSSMCAPGALNSYHNPFGDNPVSTCGQCGSTGRDWCTYKDKYAGGGGPLMCLKDGNADVAFLRSIDVDYLTNSQYGNPPAYREQDYMLLCPDGGTKPIGEYVACNWGEAPANVIVTSAARSADTRKMYKEFFLTLARDFPPYNYGGPVNPGGGGGVDDDTNTTTTTTTTAAPALTVDDPFTLFNTNSTYGVNALVSSSALDLAEVIVDGYDYAGGDNFQRKLDSLQKCAITTIRFCVVSEYEMRKCELMLLALSTRGLKPELDCILDNSTQNCMAKIADGDADIIVLDAGDVYDAGRYYDLVPIANENYGDTGNFYYAVAVSRKTESKLTLFNLIARNSCHGSMRSASGWIYPVLSLMETGQITPGKCEAVKKVGELFRRSCVPGVLDQHYNKAGTNPVNLCENCAAGGMDKCQRNTRELYYGDSGSFRCLVENGGDIAYVRHMTPRDNTDGRNADFWARNRRSDDYELLCKNGRRAPLNNWNSCYLAKVPARAVVTASYRSASERSIYWNLLNYAQQFYSSDSHSYFTMFDSGVDQDDLLFSDSTVRLVEVDPEKQTYEAYLGESFLKAVNTLNQFDCSSGQITLTANILVTLLCAILSRQFVL